MDNRQLEKTNYVNPNEIIVRPADWCLVLALFCNFLILIGEPLKNSTIGSLGSRGLIVALLGFALLQLFALIDGQKLKNAHYFIALVISILLSAILSGISGIYQNLIKLICFFMLPISLLLYKNVYNVKKVKKLIYLFNLLYTILFTILSFSSLSNIYYGEYGTEILDELTLGYANPNQTGILVMMSFIIALSASLQDIKKGYKVMYIIQSIWMFILVYRTKSRTCIIISIVILLIWLFKLTLKVGKKLTIFCFLVPLIMALLLLIGDERLQSILVLEEEFGTGRVNIFKKVTQNLSLVSFFFGDFTTWIGGNLHNSYFTIFAIFGLVGLIIYLVFLWKMIKDYFTQIDKKSLSSMMAFVGVLGAIAHGATESTLLTAGMVYGSLVSLLFILTLNEDK